MGPARVARCCRLAQRYLPEEMEAARGPRAAAPGGVGRPVRCSALLQPGSDLHWLICHAGTPRAGAPAGRGGSGEPAAGKGSSVEVGFGLGWALGLQGWRQGIGHIQP